MLFLPHQHQSFDKRPRNCQHFDGIGPLLIWAEIENRLLDQIFSENGRKIRLILTTAGDGT